MANHQPMTSLVLFGWNEARKTLKHFITVSWRAPVSNRSHAVIELYDIFFFSFSTKIIPIYFFLLAGLFRWPHSFMLKNYYDGSINGNEKLFILLLSGFSKKRKTSETKKNQPRTWHNHLRCGLPCVLSEMISLSL